MRRLRMISPFFIFTFALYFASIAHYYLSDADGLADVVRRFTLRMLIRQHALFLECRAGRFRHSAQVYFL